MHVKKMLTGLCCGALLLTVFCQDTGTSPDADQKQNDTPEDSTQQTTETEAAYGIFRLLIDQDAKSTAFSGVLSDGITPEVPWESVMKSGALELLVPTHPFCNESCGSNGLCVTDDSCSSYPTKIPAGTITVSGVHLKDGTSSFTSTPIMKFYSSAAKFSDTPFDANSTITLSAEGTDDVSAFELSASGVEPIELLNDTVKMVDGEPISLSWTAPSVTGTSIMNIEIDISYHGGTRAKVSGDCEDNGSVVIPADMLTQLKSYGISGFPKITMTRRASSIVSSEAKAQLVVEATRQVAIEIPGVISCNPGNDDVCPDGQTCQDDRRCE